MVKYIGSISGNSVRKWLDWWLIVVEGVADVARELNVAKLHSGIGFGRNVNGTPTATLYWRNASIGP